MSGEDRRAAEEHSLRAGLGSMALSMMALWLGPVHHPGDFDDLPKRIGPTVLTVWTLIGVALGAALSVLRFAFGADAGSPVGFATTAPMFLPLLLGVARLPGRRGPALAGALVLGTTVGVGLALVLPVLIGTYWGVFLALSAGALLASATYGAVAHP